MLILVPKIELLIHVSTLKKHVLIKHCVFKTLLQLQTIRFPIGHKIKYVVLMVKVKVRGYREWIQSTEILIRTVRQCVYVCGSGRRYRRESKREGRELKQRSWTDL